MTEKPSTYTGPTDPYGSPQSTFPGPFVTGARVCEVTTREITPLGPDGPRRRVTVLTVEQAGHRLPSLLRATVDGPPSAWAVHADYDRHRGPACAIAAALTTDGIPAEVVSTGYRLYAVAVVLESPEAEPHWLTVGLDGELVWTHDAPDGDLASGHWPSSDPADAARYVRRWLDERGIRPKR
ncbi:hypothetical protein ACFXPX_36795 [Kitasatospora sp. NPDC059146]|uniref:hypothetical protein n=1 Tax=unclassified Kitasatospora TaxID=2633591 RepID=UPI0036B1176C